MNSLSSAIDNFIKEALLKEMPCFKTFKGDKEK